MKVGTVIHGTLRSEDLFESFINEIESKDSLYIDDQTKNLLGEARRELTLVKDDISENDSEIIEDLIDKINSFVPEGYYFGTLPGDGSDFGYWPLYDFENVKIEMFRGVVDGIKINSFDEENAPCVYELFDLDIESGKEKQEEWDSISSESPSSCAINILVEGGTVQDVKTSIGEPVQFCEVDLAEDDEDSPK